jgi:hypothetical protein
MSGWQDFRRVGLKGSVVDVEAEPDCATEPNILRVVSYLSIREEESHCNQCSDNHSVSSSQNLPVTHITCQHGALQIISDVN